MLISFNWLKKYVNLPDSVSASEVAEKLKLTTVEVESVQSLGAHLDNIVVGKIVEVEKHPNADKLRLCQVDVGQEKLSIVCGGSNLVVGQLVVVAKVGASVRWHGEGDPIVLEPATIRGVASEGMICGADEVGLLDRFPKKEEKEIVDVTAHDYKPGQPLAEALGLNDSILEIDNKSLSHRPDLWGHYGLAREVAVLFNRSVQPYPVSPVKPGKGLKLQVSVNDSKACPRYMAVALSGVRVGPSPTWLKNYLESVGQRSINNIVDSTNFVMLDLGQPLHAFDATKLVVEGDKQAVITVRLAQAGEKIITLDGQERQLDSSMLVIANSAKPLVVAGIMGGSDSGISDTTTTIVLEAATFNAGLVRQTSTKLNLRTDSSMRFEKNLDPNLPAMALMQAVALIKEICPGASVASAITDIYPVQHKPRTLEIPLDFFAKKIGCDIALKTITTIVERLGFGVKTNKKSILVTVPTWRATKDVVTAEDVVEEVLRFYGYDQVPATLPVFPIVSPEKNCLRALERLTATVLARELGYTEMYNYSFVSAEQIKKLDDETEKYLELDNPISKVKPYLRRNLLPNLLENIQTNLSGNERLKLFEIGKVFRGDEAGPRMTEKSDDLLPRQDTWLTVGYTAQKDSAPFWEVRRVSDILGIRLRLPLQYLAAEAQPLAPWQHPTRTAWIYSGEYLIGHCYELHPLIAERHGLSERVAFLSYNISLLAEHSLAFSAGAAYQPLLTYPTVVRDLAFVVAKTHTHAELVSLMQAADPLVMTVELFDVYEGKHVDSGKKSLAYRLTYGSLDRTLKNEEVDAVEKKIIDKLIKKFQIEMR